MGVYIHNIYYIYIYTHTHVVCVCVCVYIYERFSDFWYGFGAGEFITEPDEAHTESVVRVQGI